MRVSLQFTVSENWESLRKKARRLTQSQLFQLKECCQTMACNLLLVPIWTYRYCQNHLSFHKQRGSKIRFLIASNPFSVTLYDYSWNHTSYNKNTFSGTASGYLLIMKGRTENVVSWIKLKESMIEIIMSLTGR